MRDHADHMEVIEDLREVPIDEDSWTEGLVVLYRESVAMCLLASRYACWHQGLTMREVLDIYRPIRDQARTTQMGMDTIGAHLRPLGKIWEALEGATREGRL